MNESEWLKVFHSIIQTISHSSIIIWYLFFVISGLNGLGLRMILINEGLKQVKRKPEKKNNSSPALRN